MGVVLRAYDPQLDRRVAIKLLTGRPAGIVDGTTINLRDAVDPNGLLEEARALAQVSDPHVLAIHEIGIDGDRSFLVTELVDGRDLRQWLAAAPRVVTAIFEVFAQAGRGLAAAHRGGVIHRDFKPENVLISKDGRARVCDFGIAAFARKSQLIRDGVVGTPRYMAPELWGESAATTSSDIYAFAFSLTEAVCNEVPSEPAQVDEALAKRGVPAHTRALIVRALAADPTRRPASLDELVASLSPRSRSWWPLLATGAAVTLFGGIVAASTLGGPTEPACSPSQPLLDARWNDGARAAVIAAVRARGGTETDAKKITSGFDRHARAWIEQRAHACEAPTSERVAPLACLDRRLIEFGATIAAISLAPNIQLARSRGNSLGVLATCLRAVEVTLPSAPRAREAIERLTARVLGMQDAGIAGLASEGDQAGLAAARAEALTLGDFPLTVRIDRIRAQLASNGRRRDFAIHILEEAYELATEHHLELGASMIMVDAAFLARANMQLDVAMSKLAAARAHLLRAPEASARERMHINHEFSDVAALRGQLSDAHVALDEARAAAQQLDPPDPMTLATIDRSGIELLEREGKLDAALQLARATEMRLRALGDIGVPVLGDVLLLIARIERQRGHAERSLAIQRERVALLDRYMPVGDSGRMNAHAHLGLELMDAGQYDEAKQILTRALEQAKKDPALIGNTEAIRNYLARTERMLGNYDAARLQLDEAIATTRARVPELDPTIAVHELTYALVELDAGDLDRAAVHARIAADVSAVRAADSVERLDVADLQIALALAHGDAPGAMAIADKTIALLVERGVTDARIERFWLGSAQARNLAGDYRGARTMADRVLAGLRARQAPPLELAEAQIEVAKADYAFGDRAALGTLRQLGRSINTPSQRFTHGLLIKWFRARRLPP